MAKLNEYLTVDEVAAILGVSDEALRRTDSAGKQSAWRHALVAYRLYLSHEPGAVEGGASSLAGR